MEKNGIGASVEMLVIGGSAGSLDVIVRLLPALRPDLPFPVIIVLHRKSASDSTLVDLLAAKTSLQVKEADEKEEVQPGIIYVAPSRLPSVGGKQTGTLSLDDSKRCITAGPV